ncbi:JmjC domain-containing protein [Streptomyces sp. NPDC088252]|uniref:JmjC domain-containing protein n=1 Tax=Streptomyces sp. NPDC088252 TaxID=3365845 RepID=UPI0037FB0D54
MQLHDLVGSLDSIRTSWPDQPQVFPHDPVAFRDLLTMKEVDELIDTGCIAARNIVLLRDGAVVEPYEYTDGDMPNPGAVRAHLDEGGSISLRLLHTLYPNLAHLKDDIQNETGCRAHVNAYLTPGDRQGLRYHYDPYVTLIVQLHGRKVWHLHPPIVERPTEEHDNFRLRGWTDEEYRYLSTTSPRDVVLEPGDVFWLPRGWVHSPETKGAVPSLHLTFALKERTHAWLVEHLVEILIRHVRADFDAREVITPADLFDGTDALEWARKVAIGALAAVDGEAAINSARHKARTT